ncbi:hypothetical protein, partial [Streptococcus pneumoniae]|uniref:hypothetical protein n=1 Tax=Streptococcus pneumoniae TaxID=1313 RepID=UPI0013DBA079
VLEGATIDDLKALLERLRAFTSWAVVLKSDRNESLPIRLTNTPFADFGFCFKALEDRAELPRQAGFYGHARASV